MPGKPLIIDIPGMCFGERVKMEVYRVGVRGEVEQYNCMGLKEEKKIGFNW